MFPLRRSVPVSGPLPSCRWCHRRHSGRNRRCSVSLDFRASFPTEVRWSPHSPILSWASGPPGPPLPTPTVGLSAARLPSVLPAVTTWVATAWHSGVSSAPGSAFLLRGSVPSWTSRPHARPRRFKRRCASGLSHSPRPFPSLAGASGLFEAASSYRSSPGTPGCRSCEDIFMRQIGRAHV